MYNFLIDGNRHTAPIETIVSLCLLAVSDLPCYKKLTTRFTMEFLQLIVNSPNMFIDLWAKHCITSHENLILSFMQHPLHNILAMSDHTEELAMNKDFQFIYSAEDKIKTEIEQY